ncbi:hypothetical protein HDU84_007288 [Entophlyctis sp. JEL0112]|nr:hypothetical protein HDU84_007288 [Entophlyctis sp. JEL0112]
MATLSIRQLIAASSISGAFFFVGDLANQISSMLPLRESNAVGEQHSQKPKSVRQRWTESYLQVFDRWDRDRTLKMAMFGFGVNGWTSLCSLHLLDTVVGPSKTFGLAATKAILNQVLYSPPYLASFLYFSAAHVRQPPDADPWATVADKFPTVYASAWALWPAVNLVSFRYIPAGIPRVAFANAMGLGWTVYLAHVGSSTRRFGGGDRVQRMDSVDNDFAL